MDAHFIHEIIGYAASLLIAISMMLSSVLFLRFVNLTGAALFTIYGLLIGAYPVAVLNGLIVFVNGWHIARMLRAAEYFHLLRVRSDSDYLDYFLNFHGDDIRRSFPDFDFDFATRAEQMKLLVLRDCVPAGLFIADEAPGGVLNVQLDYAIPRYRDLKVGKFLFVDQATFFRDHGVREIVIKPRTAQLGEYLAKIGFQPATGGDGAMSIHYAAAA